MMDVFMTREPRSGGEGLERSCTGPGAGWIASHRPAPGLELFRAWFPGVAYDTHRHDTYAVGVTECGVQVFDYRGAVRRSTAGQVVILYPDEAHDGRAGTADGFGYRIIYLEPSRLAAALREICERPSSLPFVRDAVVGSAWLSRAVRDAFRARLEPLAVDALVVDLAEGLLGAEHGETHRALTRTIDGRAVERARQFLDAERARVVRSRELETVTGLSRYALARQFRAALGTSPYRYLVMRRLDDARERIGAARSLVDVACETGFADQAHFTRAFKAAYGLTPARYRALRATTSRRR
jgi:AraC-like DNA-binding protein